jgi:hypothetical protein
MLCGFVIIALTATVAIAVPQFTEITTAPVVGVASGTSSTVIGNYYN